MEPDDPDEDEDDSINKTELEELSYEYTQMAIHFIKALDNKYSLHSIRKVKEHDSFFKELRNNFDTINWYHAFIYVKLKRAIWSKDEMLQEDDEEMKEIIKSDIDGTAKVAVLSINRSVAALNVLYNILPEFSKEISGLLVLLGNILNIAELEFPDYQKFIRPGFDTIQ